MKKIILLVLTVLSLITANADVPKLYQDVTGQVFTKPAEGRTLIKPSTSIFAKTDKLNFSGLAYIGYIYDDYKNGFTNVSEFQIRRAYFQVKAYLLDDPKSYYRITFDVSKDVTGDEKVRAKYAYLFLNNIFTNTGIEIGLTHRPWHDYEEHNSWLYRDISKIFIEDKKSGPDLSNSADFGVMFKTRTQFFDADYGIFNGEGYHSVNNGNGMSFEWRATAHILGMSSHHHPEKNAYWDTSFFGQYNQNHKKLVDTSGNFIANEDLIFGALHTVYNQPSFLVAAQYIYSKNTRSTTLTTSTGTSEISAQAGQGYSINGEYRMGDDKKYRLLARYDSWTPKTIPTSKISKKEDKAYTVGAAWEQSSNLQWVINTIITDNEAGSVKEVNNGIAYMITTEIRF